MEWKFPVSAKGVLIGKEADRVMLVKNERNEWELPGGRIEKGEQPREAVIREIHEELSIECRVDRLIDNWLFEVIPGKYVYISAYLCSPVDRNASVRLSDEHEEYRWVSISDLDQYNMAEEYKAAIRKAIS